MTTAAKEPAAKETAKAPTKTKKPNPAGKMSALDAAAKVLAESGEPMTTKEMIETMAANNYWISPGGVTPHATLYSALLREINAKGADARFVKVDRGQFAAKK
jgi:vancomycin resistance protein YoaR